MSDHPHLHFDMAKVEAAVAAAKAGYEAKASEEGEMGARARLCRDILPGFTRWLMEEANRGTNSNHINAATGAAMAGIMLNWAGSVIPDKNDKAAATEAVNYLNAIVAHFIVAGINLMGTGSVTSVEGDPGGRA